MSLDKQEAMAAWTSWVVTSTQGLTVEVSGHRTDRTYWWQMTETKEREVSKRARR